jgi:hypothetical protein
LGTTGFRVYLRYTGDVGKNLSVALATGFNFRLTYTIFPLEWSLFIQTLYNNLYFNNDTHMVKYNRLGSINASNRMHELIEPSLRWLHQLN